MKSSTRHPRGRSPLPFDDVLTGYREVSIRSPQGVISGGASAGACLAAAATLRVIAAGPRFGVDGAFERFVRIPFSHSAEETERGVDALAAAWASVGRHPVAASSELAAVV